MKEIIDLKPGDLILYPYLWSWQTGSGKMRGDKVRPTIVLYRGKPETPEANKIILCAITSADVHSPNIWVDIPESEAARAKIQKVRGSKVVISECNVDDLSHSTHVFAQPLLPDRFSDAFVSRLRARFMTMLREHTLKHVKREETTPRAPDRQRGPML